MSENRRIKRLLLRKGGTKDITALFSDNKGEEYDKKWVAQVASLYNIVMGCLKNGFPVVLDKFHYAAWAFYPFFFIKKVLPVEMAVTILNHERIHIRQQREIHLWVSLPLGVLFIGVGIPELLLLLPFLPTVAYFVNLLIVKKGRSIEVARKDTAFEREAISKSTNTDYLFTRKPFSWVAYTGIKFFNKYGV